MGRFHITPNGEIKPCHAQQGKCPYGGAENHFDTVREAQAEINKRELENLSASERNRALDGLTKEARQDAENQTPNLKTETKEYYLSDKDRMIMAIRSGRDIDTIVELVNENPDQEKMASYLVAEGYGLDSVYKSYPHNSEVAMSYALNTDYEPALTSYAENTSDPSVLRQLAKKEGNHQNALFNNPTVKDNETVRNEVFATMVKNNKDTHEKVLNETLNYGIHDDEQKVATQFMKSMNVIESEYGRQYTKQLASQYEQHPNTELRRIFANNGYMSDEALEQEKDPVARHFGLGRTSDVNRFLNNKNASVSDKQALLDNPRLSKRQAEQCVKDILSTEGSLESNPENKSISTYQSLRNTLRYRLPMDDFYEGDGDYRSSSAIRNEMGTKFYNSVSKLPEGSDRSSKVFLLSSAGYGYNEARKQGNQLDLDIYATNGYYSDEDFNKSASSNRKFAILQSLNDGRFGDDNFDDDRVSERYKKADILALDPDPRVRHELAKSKNVGRSALEILARDDAYAKERYEKGDYRERNMLKK